MESSPRRLQSAALLSLVLSIAAGAAALGVFELLRAELELRLLLWFGLALLGTPAALLAGYALYALARARYRLDRDGFTLRWGMAVEQAPLDQVQGIYAAEDLAPDGPASTLFAWLGWHGVVHKLADGRTAEIFATGSPGGGMLVDLGSKLIWITPSDRQGFLEAFRTVARQGSLSELPTCSYRPDFLVGPAWRDRAARVLLALGGGLAAGLILFIVLRAGSLGPQIHFGFDARGSPGPLVPAGRLLLLPMIAIVVWMVNTAVGLLLFRRRRGQPIAYGVWATSLLTSAMLWAAVLMMLSGFGRP